LNAEIAIWADSLTRVYRSGGAEVVVFRDLSLRVPYGQRLAIIGESGAGKSTLLHLLGGLERPDAGRIFFDGRNILAFNDDELGAFRNRQIGFIWQKPSLLPEFTALENVMMPLLIRGVPPRTAADIARNRLMEVGLKSRALHRSGELSGGEQQRVALARALAGKPAFLLADEPTGSLDFRTGEAVISLLSDLHAAHGLTSIFVTHNLAFARKCDQVWELKKGDLHQFADKEWQEAGVIQDATRLSGGTYV
jgi:lipoprotein-releasing system ATP-binding protein